MRKLCTSSKIKILGLFCIGLFCVEVYVGIEPFFNETSYINGIYVISDDPFFGDEQKAINSNLTLHLTDSFSINVSTIRLNGRIGSISVILQILDPTNRQVYYAIKSVKNQIFSTVVFGFITIDPSVFTMVGSYTVNVYHSRVWNGVSKDMLLNSSKIYIDREIVDISCAYVDEIYLQTKTTPFYHNITVSGSIFEAGEINKLKNVELKLYWREANTTNSFLGCFNSSQMGRISHNFQRTRTVHYDLMQVYAHYDGNSTHKPADSRYPSPFLSTGNQNKHIIKNAQDGENDYDILSPGNFPKPRSLVISNMNKTIWSPNGNDQDIEDWDFSVNPFTNNSRNTPSYGSTEDGFDHWIESDIYGIITNNTIRNITIINQEICPINIFSYIGEISNQSDNASLVLEDDKGITVYSEEIDVNANTSYFMNKMCFTFFTLFPLRQISALNLILKIKNIENVTFSNFTIHQIDENSKRFLLLNASNGSLIPDTLNIQHMEDFSDNMVTFEVMINSTSAFNLLCDLLYILIVPVNQSASRYGWKPNWTDLSNSTIYFESIGGNSIENISYNLGTDIHIPVVPFYSIQNTYFGLNFSYHKVGSFNLSLDMLFTTVDENGSMHQEQMEIWSHDNLVLFGSRSIRLNLTQLFGTSNLTYITFVIRNSEIDIGDEFTIEILDFYLNSVCKLEYLPSSIMEQYTEKIQTNNAINYPSKVDYQFDPSYIINNAVINSTIDHVIGSQDKSFMENDTLWNAENGSVSTSTDFNGDGFNDYNITSSQLAIPFNSTPELRTLNYSHVSIGGSQSPDVFSNESLYQMYVKNDDPEYTLTQSVFVNDSLGEISYHNNTGKNTLNYAILTPKSEVILRLPIDLSKKNIRSTQTKERVRLRIQVLQSYSIYYSPNTPVIFKLQRILPISYNNYTYRNCTPMSGFNPLYSSLNLSQGNVTTFDITNAMLDCYEHNNPELFFYFKFNNDSVINVNTSLTIADYDFLLDHSMSYANISSVFYQITYQDDFEVLYKVVCPDLARLTSVTLNCIAQVNNGKMNFSIITPSGLIPTSIQATLYAAQSPINLYVITIPKAYFYSNDTILLKMKYTGPAVYNPDYSGMSGVIVNELKILYQKIICGAALYVPEPEYEGYRFDLDGMIVNNNTLIGSVFLNNNVSRASVINLSNESFVNFNNISPYYIPFNLVNDNGYYRMGIECISTSKFTIIFTNITINGGIRPLDTYEENSGLQLVYFDFNAIIALKIMDVFYEVTNENQTVSIVSIETQKYLDRSDFSSIDTIGWDEIYYCSGRTNKTGYGSTINLTTAFNVADGFATRFVRVGYTLSRGNVAQETPTLYNITLYATRTKVGNLTSIHHIADGNELIFGFPSPGEKEFVFSFYINNPTKEPFMLVSLDYICYPEFSDFPGLMLQNYSISVSNPERTVSERLPAKQRFYQELEAILITNISKYLSSGNFLLIYSLNSSYEIDFHLDYLAGCFYSNASTLLNIPHAITLELDRASNLNNVSPSSGQLWNGLNQFHSLNDATDTASITNWYPFNEEKRTILMNRTTMEYYGRIIQSGPGTDEEVIVKPSRTIDMNGLYAGTPLNRYVCSLINPGISTKTELGNYLSITGTPNDNTPIGVQYDFSSIVPAGTDKIKFRTDVDAYVTFNKLFFFIPISFSIQLSASMVYNGSTYQIGSTDWIDYSNINSLRIQTSFPLSSIAAFFFQSYSVSMRVYSVAIATQNQHALQFGLSDPTDDYAYVNSTTYLHIVPKVNADELDGIVFDGALDYYVSEFTRNMNPQANARVKLFVEYGINNTDIIAEPEEQVDDYDYNWFPLTFPHYNQYQGTPYSLNIDQTFAAFGSSLHKASFSFDSTVDGAYKYYLPRSIFFNNSFGEPCAIIRAKLSYSHPKDFNTIPSANDPFNAYLSYQTYIGWNNIRIKMLYSNDKFRTEKDNIHNFGFSFDISKQEISDNLESGFDLSNVWYFGTKIDLSIYPHWADQPFTSYVQFNKQDIRYKLWLGIESRVSGKIQPVTLPTQTQEYKPLNYIKNSYELIFAQSEDRASLGDPNALRVDTTDIDDYFVYDEEFNEVLRFYVNVSIMWNSIEQYNARRWDEPGTSANKSITILVKDITTIDIMFKPERKDFFDQIPLPIYIPQPKNNIFKKVTRISLSITGTLEVDSLELFHTVYQATGFRIVLFTSTGGTEVLGEVSNDDIFIKNFTLTVDIPTLKLDNNDRIELAIQVGVFNFYFTGLYDDVGYVYLKIREIDTQFTYHTGFSDVWSNELYIEKPISYNLDENIPENIEAILVKTEIDYAMQFVEIDENGIKHNYGSPQIPTLLAYNFVSKTYSMMVCFSEQSNVFDYVLDNSLYSDLSEFFNGGSMKLIFLLDGRGSVDESNGNQIMSYVHLDVIKMEMEFLNPINSNSISESMQRIKPSMNVCTPNDWLLPYTHRQVIMLSNTEQTNVTLSCELNFTTQSSEGIYNNQYAVINSTGGKMQAQLKDKSYNASYIVSALLECFLFNYTPGIIYLYWADYNATFAWDYSFNFTSPLYSGDISIEMLSYTEFYPYSFSLNEKIITLYDIDYHVSEYPFINITASAPLEFDFSNLDYSLRNITTIKLRIAELSQVTSDISVSIFDYNTKIMRKYLVNHRIVDNYYFTELEQKISILNLNPAEIISFLTPENKLALIIESSVENGCTSSWKVNLVEIEIHYNEIPSAMVNASFDQYIVDQDNIESLRFYDIFEGDLEGWVGDVDEYGIINSALTKTSVPTPYWWRWWRQVTWWHPATKASHIFVNQTENATAYFADFKLKIKNTPSSYKTANWLVHSSEYYKWCEGKQVSGLLFTLHAYQSSRYSANELHIWKKYQTSPVWRLVDVVNVPFRVNVDAWYRVTMHVNNTFISVKINGTSIYSDYITVNDNSGYFGFRSNYANQFLIDDVVISDEELPGGNFQGYFSNFTVNMTDSSILQYEDQLSVNLSSIPPNFNGSISGQKFELLVNSTDGWLILDEAQTDSNGAATFDIDTVDLATFDLLGSNYPKMVNYSIINDTTTIAVNDTFENGLSQWISDNLPAFSTENGYLEKKYYSSDDSILTQDHLIGNYSISFDFMKNPDRFDDYIQYYIDVDAALHNGYVYRIYTSEDSSTPNVIKLYRLSGGTMSLIDTNDINEEILGSTWYNVEIKIVHSNGTISHQTLINDEVILESAFTPASYFAGDYSGFNLEIPHNVAVDNVLIYNGTKEISKQTLEPCQLVSPDSTVIKLDNLRYLDQGITRVENMYYVEKPYSLIDNSLEIGVSLNLSFLANEFYKQFDYSAYYGLKVGILLPYDEITESVDVYIQDIEGEVGRVMLNFADLNQLYNEPNGRAVIVNGVRMLKTDVWLSLAQVKQMNASYLKYIGIQMNRITPEYSRYLRNLPNNTIGICSIQLSRQLNNYTYSNYHVAERPEFDVCVYYRGSGKIISSKMIFEGIKFQRSSASIELTGTQEFSIEYGEEFSAPLQILQAYNSVLPACSRLTIPSVLLLVKKKGVWTKAALNYVDALDQESLDMLSFVGHFRPFVSAGNYSEVKLIWLGNGLYNPAEITLSSGIPLEIKPTDSQITISALNGDVTYGQSAQITGLIQDTNSEMIKDKDFMFYQNNFTSNHINYQEITDLPSSNYTANYSRGLFSIDASMAYGKKFTFSPTNDSMLVNNYYPINYVNIFRLVYYSNTPDVELTVELKYNDSSSQIRSMKLGRKDTWTNLYVETEPDLYNYNQNLSLIGYAISIKSLVSQDIELCIQDIQFVHLPLVYLQVNSHLGWRNLALGEIEIKDMNTSEYQLKLFPSDQQFLMKNIYQNYWNVKIYNASLLAGDYECRIYYPGYANFFNPSYSNFFIRVNPIQTAIYYRHDGEGNVTAGGLIGTRKYNSTTIFALESGKPYTLVQLGSTWGDNRSLEFKLCQKNSPNLDGLANKPLWVQIGIVPNSYYGLKFRDYFADYYPMTRDIKSSMLFANTYFIQNKYNRPILYDYYDLASGSQQFYGPVLWQVYYTDKDGYIDINWTLTSDYFDYLKVIFAGKDLPNIEKDLYVRVFYSNLFSWNDMVLPIRDPIHANQPITCSWLENQKDETKIYNKMEAEYWKSQNGGIEIYFDGIYSSSYAEGYINVNREGLSLRAQNVEVSLTGYATDTLSLVSFLNETERSEVEAAAIEPMIKVNEWNKFNELEPRFFLMDEGMKKIIVGGDDTVAMLGLVDCATGEITFDMTTTTISWEYWQKVIPGYYKVACYVPESYYYDEASVTYTVLVKSPYTYNFIEPASTADLQSIFQSQAQAAAINKTSNEYIYNFTNTDVYPVLCGYIWQENLTHTDGLTASIGINDFPVYKQEIFPGLSYEVNIPLKSFELLEKLNISLITYSNELPLTDIDIEDPWESNSTDDRVFFDLYVKIPTVTNPVENSGLIVCNLTQIVQNNVDFSTITGNKVVQLSHVVKNRNSYENFQVTQGNLIIDGSTRDGILMYPEGLNVTTRVHINLDQIGYMINKSEYLENLEPGLETLNGWQFDASANFLDSIRECVLEGDVPENDSSGVRIAASTQYTYALTYENLYMPYLGYFSGKFIPTRSLTPGEQIDVNVTISYGSHIKSTLWSTKFLNTSSGSHSFLINTTGVVDSMYFNVTIYVDGKNISTPIGIVLYNSSIRGFEDVLAVSTHMPKRRAALYSTNFLYYFIRNPGEIDLDNESTVKVAVENRRFDSQHKYQNLEDVLQIYQQADVTTFVHDPQEPGATGYTQHGKSQNYTFPADPDTGIFIRSQVFGQKYKEIIDLYTGFVVLYHQNASGNYNEIAKRKVSLFIKPKEWIINAQFPRIIFNGTSSSLNVTFDNTRLDKGDYVDSTWVRATYHGYSALNDKVWNGCNKVEFYNNWNRSASSKMSWDIWTNSAYFTLAEITNAGTYQHNLMDFYPNATSDWTSFEALETILRINNTYFVEHAELRLYNNIAGGTAVSTMQVDLDENSTSIPVSWNLTQIPQNLLSNIQRLDMVLVINASRIPQVLKEVIYFETSGVALKSRSSAIKMYVKYGGENSEHEISSSFDRNFFTLGSSSTDSTPLVTTKNIEYISIKGTQNLKLDFFRFEIMQNHTLVDGADPVTLQQFTLDFDPVNERLDDQLKLSMNIEPVNWTKSFTNVQWSYVNDQTMFVKYRDRDYDGIYDRMEIYEDYMGGEYGDGINDQYSIDYENDGFIDKVYSKTMIQQHIDTGDDTYVDILEYRYMETDLMKSDLFGYTMRTYESTLRYTSSNLVRFPYVRIRKVSNFITDLQRADEISEDRDEWRLNRGIDDFETHYRYTWNSTKNDYDVAYWHDWAAVLSVSMIGGKDSGDAYYPVITNLHGILDKGVTEVPINPAITALGEQDQYQTGTYFWVNSNNLTQHVDNWDMAFVIVYMNDTSNSFSQVQDLQSSIRANTVAAISVILDSNKDHVFQPESTLEDDPPYFDQYYPFWMVSPGLRSILKSFAYANSLADWCENMAKPASILKIVIEVVVTYIISWLISFIVAKLWPGGEFAHLGLIASFFTFVFMCFLGPLIDEWFDPKASENRAHNYNKQTLMLTSIDTSTLPTGHTYRGSTPKQNFNYYKAHYRGWSLGVYGSFDPTSSITAAPGGADWYYEILNLHLGGFISTTGEDGNPKISIPAEIYGYDPESPTWISGDEFGWQLAFNPIGLLIDVVRIGFNWIAGFFGFQEDLQGYEQYVVQKEVLEAAYTKVLGFNTTEKVIRILPYFKDGKPLYLAIEDDLTLYDGVTQFWAENTDVWKRIEKNALIFSVKYQSFYTSNWEVALYNFLVTVVKIVACTIAAKAGASSGSVAGGGQGSKITLSGVLKELAEEYIRDEWLLNNLLGGIADLAVLSIWNVDISDYTPFGMGFGDIIEWLAGIAEGKRASTNYRQYQEIMTELQQETETIENEDLAGMDPATAQEVLKYNLEAKRERMLQILQKGESLRGEFKNALSMAVKMVAMFNTESMFKQLKFSAIKLKYGDKVKTEQDQKIAQAFMENTFIRLASESLMLGAKRSIAYLLQETTRLSQKAGYLATDAYFYLEIVGREGEEPYTIGKIDEKTGEISNADLCSLDLAEFFSNYEFTQMRIVDPKLKGLKRPIYSFEAEADTKDNTRANNRMRLSQYIQSETGITMGGETLALSRRKLANFYPILDQNTHDVIGFIDTNGVARIFSSEAAAKAFFNCLKGGRGEVDLAAYLQRTYGSNPNVAIWDEGRIKIPKKTGGYIELDGFAVEYDTNGKILSADLCDAKMWSVFSEGGVQLMSVRAAMTNYNLVGEIRRQVIAVYNKLHNDQQEWMKTHSDPNTNFNLHDTIFIPRVTQTELATILNALYSNFALTIDPSKGESISLNGFYLTITIHDPASRNLIEFTIGFALDQKTMNDVYDECVELYDTVIGLLYKSHWQGPMISWHP